MMGREDGEAGRSAARRGPHLVSCLSKYIFLRRSRAAIKMQRWHVMSCVHVDVKSDQLRRGGEEGARAIHMLMVSPLPVTKALACSNVCTPKMSVSVTS
jgi:hypothetical protein